MIWPATRSAALLTSSFGGEIEEEDDDGNYLRETSTTAMTINRSLGPGGFSKSCC